MSFERPFRRFLPSSALSTACLALGIVFAAACGGGDDLANPGELSESARTPAPACEPGAVQLCYDGPQATRDVGLCRAGTSTCLPDGSGFGPCEGQIQPAVESCTTSGDDDCNGSTECEGVYVWAKSFGDDLEQVGARAAIDAKGNIALAGTFSGAIDFGGGPIKAPPGGEDGFVVRLSPSGEYAWSMPLGGPALDVAVDHEGSTFVLSLEGMGLITKIDRFGGLLWTKDIGGDPSMTARIATDAEGNLIITGRFSSIAPDFGGGPLTVHGGGDAYVAKLDWAGEHIFSKSFGDPGAQQADSLAVGADGTIYVLGKFDGSIDIGGSPLKSSTGPDLFVAKLTPKGDPLWAKGLYGDTALDYAGDIAVDAKGDIIVTGGFDGNMSFDAETMSSPKGQHSLFVAKLDGSSGALWMKHFVGQTRTGSVAVDASGNIFVSGLIKKPMDFGKGPIGDVGHGYVAKLDASGAALWSRAFLLGESAVQPDFLVETDAPGSMLIVTGFFKGSADFGGPPLTSEGLHDIFVTRLTP